MTKNKAESITGASINITPHPEGGLLIIASKDDKTIASIRAVTTSEGLETMVSIIYAKNRTEAFSRDGWRCSACGDLMPLQGDHKKPRSKGRSDETDNISSKCPRCHQRKHNGKIRI